MNRAMAGATAVVHLAAKVHARGRQAKADEFRRVNVEGTVRVIEEAAKAGVERVIVMSSVKAVGNDSGDAVWTEATDPAPADPYGSSKLEAERLALKHAKSAGLDLVVLRLPVVFGPGMKANMLRLFSAVAQGVPLPFGAIRNRRSLLYVGHLCAGVAAVLEARQRCGGIYFLCETESVSTPSLVNGIANAMQRPARVFPVPVPVLRGVGRLGDVLGRGLSRWPITSETIDALTGSLAVDSSKFRGTFGFRPVTSLAESLRETAGWYVTLRRSGIG